MYKPRMERIGLIIPCLDFDLSNVVSSEYEVAIIGGVKLLTLRGVCDSIHGFWWPLG